eukprot:CAMPEP_0206124150 /NCGR_PEP_ID=MMETSP1472-20131121/9915_1 /ASSEMBLY_ACC=CAM_ASM_001108 /TAXON_ID=41880 /ORGANISM="Pycnococcus provasolii, Strain RCC251" /LENGTH=70 /DNA_ID=CAMNT_0053514869 /DNA_START=169 /DNA_END=382 /DNA_ORIENTATION=-
MVDGVVCRQALLEHVPREVVLHPCVVVRAPYVVPGAVAAAAATSVTACIFAITSLPIRLSKEAGGEAVVA